GVHVVDDDVDDGSLGPLRRLDQGSLHGLEVVDHVRVAIEQLDEKVSSQGVQSSGPPFSDPIIYRTSPATPAGVAARRKNFSFTPKTCFTVWPGFFDCKKKTPSEGSAAAPPSPVAAGKRLSASEKHSPRDRPEPPPDRLRCLPSTFRLHRSAATVE